MNAMRSERTVIGERTPRPNNNVPESRQRLNPQLILLDDTQVYGSARRIERCVLIGIQAG
jgi:hypothetical protein